MGIILNHLSPAYHRSQCHYRFHLLPNLGLIGFAGRGRCE
jgi:hypothetical protein